MDQLLKILGIIGKLPVGLFRIIDDLGRLAQKAYANRDAIEKRDPVVIADLTEDVLAILNQLTKEERAQLIAFALTYAGTAKD